MALSAKTLEKLADFMASEVGTEVLDGRTYVFALAGEDKKLKKIEDIRAAIKADGENPSSIFKGTKVNNGYVFDMSIDTARKMVALLTQKFSPLRGAAADLVGDGPMKRAEQDIERLAKYLKSAVAEGKNVVDVALFSQNKVNKIEYVDTEKGKQVKRSYPAYAIRTYDILKVTNNTIVHRLAKEFGVGITSMVVHGILPTKTGVLCTLRVTKA